MDRRRREWLMRQAPSRTCEANFSCLTTESKRPDSFRLFINEKLVVGVQLRHEKTECADDINNWKLFHGEVSGHRIPVPSFNFASKSGEDAKASK
jgi:hypothetical protein